MADTLTNPPKMFTAGELCRIIEASAKNRVTKLKFGEIEIDFSPTQEELGYSDETSLPNIEEPIRATPASEQTLQIDHSLEMVDKDLLEDMRLAQMMIDDPLAYEQEVIDMHISKGSMDASAQN